MSANAAPDGPEVGYDIPAAVGMDESDIVTPCLLIDLDAFERNVAKMRDICADMGVRHRVHGKMHRSTDIAHYQIEHGDACGVCCQKVSEAETFARAGIKDILITNQVRQPVMVDRLAKLPKLGSRIIVCLDDASNVEELSAAASRHGTEIEVLVEIDCGSRRCGVDAGWSAVELARAIDEAPGLKFSGLQAYHGSAQHIRTWDERREAIRKAIVQVRETVALMESKGLRCPIIGGAGTGTYSFEGTSGIYNEIQAGSYAFMDADYQRILDKKDKPVAVFENALFVLTSVMSHVRQGRAVCDAGLKAFTIDSGMPVVLGHPEAEVLSSSDEHSVITDPGGMLRIHDKIRLIPGHCDPTCNLHDWYVGVRGGKVEVLWPVSARGRGY